MIFDFLNISIIREFYNLKENEKPELAKIRDRIFPNLKKSEKTYYLGKIRDRLRTMNELFQIIKKERKKTIEWKYNLKTEKVFFKKFVFPNGEKEGLALYLDGRWQIIEL